MWNLGYLFEEVGHKVTQGFNSMATPSEIIEDIKENCSMSAANSRVRMAGRTIGVTKTPLSYYMPVKKENKNDDIIKEFEDELNNIGKMFGEALEEYPIEDLEEALEEYSVDDLEEELNNIGKMFGEALEEALEEYLVEEPAEEHTKDTIAANEPKKLLEDEQVEVIETVEVIGEAKVIETVEKESVIEVVEPIEIFDNIKVVENAEESLNELVEELGDEAKAKATENAEESLNELVEELSDETKVVETTANEIKDSHIEGEKKNYDQHKKSVINEFLEAVSYGVVPGSFLSLIPKDHFTLDFFNYLLNENDFDVPEEEKRIIRAYIECLYLQDDEEVQKVLSERISIMEKELSDETVKGSLDNYELEHAKEFLNEVSLESKKEEVTPETKEEVKKETTATKKPASKRKTFAAKKEEVKEEAKPVRKEEIKEEVKEEATPETKEEVKKEITATKKPASKRNTTTKKSALGKGFDKIASTVVE